MKHNWLDAELKKVFTVTPEERVLVRGKSKPYQVLFLALYKACQQEKTVPNTIPRFSSNVTTFISDQLGLDYPVFQDIPKRSQRHLLQEVRKKLNFRRLSLQEKETLNTFSC